MLILVMDDAKTSQPPHRRRLVAGCMTGTSLDGLDVALTEITGTGLDMKAEFVGMVSRPLGDLADQLRHFAEGNPAPPIDYLRAARRLGELHAEAVEELVEEHVTNEDRSPRTAIRGLPHPSLDFVVAHGQTIWHAPRDDVGRLSWQLFDPWPIVQRLNVPVCYDLRQADLIAGGEGAPITPIADRVLFAKADKPRMVVNLGGICNITSLPGDPRVDIEAADLCPCNILIDGLVQELYPGKRYDEDGSIAAFGTAWDGFHKVVNTHPKSDGMLFSGTLGREDFGRDWIQGLRRAVPAELTPQDILASAVEVIAGHISYANQSYHEEEVILAGGGAKNSYLRHRIRELAFQPSGVYACDEIGIPCEAREAVCFAVLGALSQDGVPITLPQVTGAKASGGPGVAGVWARP